MKERQLGRKFGNGEVVMSSLDIAALTGKRHADVMRDIRVEVLNLAPELGQRIFAQSYYTNKQNKKQPCYEFSKKGAMQLALKYDAMTRFRVIEYIEELESKLKPKLPTTYKEALAELLYQVEENEKLQVENEQMKPKAQFARAVEISTNSVSVSHVAKIARKEGLDIGQNKLFAWLRDNGYLVKRTGATKNTPTQRSMDLGVMELVASTKEFNGDSKTFYTTKITGKGQIYFVNKLLKEYGQ